MKRASKCVPTHLILCGACSEGHFGDNFNNQIFLAAGTWWKFILIFLAKLQSILYPRQLIVLLITWINIFFFFQIWCIPSTWRVYLYFYWFLKSQAIQTLEFPKINENLPIKQAWWSFANFYSLGTRQVLNLIS